jgi:hypothetical protein
VALLESGAVFQFGKDGAGAGGRVGVGHGGSCAGIAAVTGWQWPAGYSAATFS